MRANRPYRLGIGHAALRDHRPLPVLDRGHVRSHRRARPPGGTARRPTSPCGAARSRPGRRPGNTLSGSFSGSGSNGVWTGDYSVHPSLDPACPFITSWANGSNSVPFPRCRRPSATGWTRTARRPSTPPDIWPVPGRTLAPPHAGSIVPVTIDTFLECGILPADADVIDEGGRSAEEADQAVPGHRAARRSGRRFEPGGSRPGRPARPRGRRVRVLTRRSTPCHHRSSSTESRGVTVGFEAAVTSAESMVRSVDRLFRDDGDRRRRVQFAGELDGGGPVAGRSSGRMKFRAPLTPATTVLELRILTDRATSHSLSPCRGTALRDPAGTAVVGRDRARPRCR